MVAATPLVIPEDSQNAIVHFERQCYGMLNNTYNIRAQMLEIDRVYMRENDFTEENRRAQLANRYGNANKFQNVTVPVVMPQVEAAVTYQASVFLTGSPIFGWVAPPENQDAALQYQAIVEENSIRGGWVNEFLLAFTDAFKYNLAAVEVDWSRQVTYVPETDVSFAAGKQAKPKEVIWEGNCIKRWDLYNSFWDTRYHPTEIAKNGEFAGTTKLMSRVNLKKFINQLPDKMISNIRAAFESGLGAPGGTAAQSYFIPLINPTALVAQDPRYSFNWMAWAGLLERPNGEINYRNLYEVTTLYARIIPQDFKLRVPSANTPQVWKFIIVNHSVLIYAERQTNAHELIPVIFAQPNHDGLGYQTKSYAKNAQPYQEVASALVNSAMAARRRAISDRGIYNPLLIAAQHINSDSPTAKIPLRPAGYAKNPSEAYFPIPYRDDQSAVAFQELPQILSMADTALGQNKVRQGQFVKGNKTMKEFDTVMANANGRDQVVAMRLESQFFTPIKEIIKINTLQYQAGVSIYSPSQERVVKIDPVLLRKSFATYKITDGLSPAEKVISGDEFAMAIQVMGSSEQIGADYNMGQAFSYLMKTRNVNLTPFEKSEQQKAYEQALAAWQQAIVLMSKQMGDNIDPSKFPPQPKPQDYGYVPGAPKTQQGQQPGVAPNQQTQVQP